MGVVCEGCEGCGVPACDVGSSLMDEAWREDSGLMAGVCEGGVKGCM